MVSLSVLCFAFQPVTLREGRGDFRRWRHWCEASTPALSLPLLCLYETNGPPLLHVPAWWAECGLSPWSTEPKQTFLLLKLTYLRHWSEIWKVDGNMENMEAMSPRGPVIESIDTWVCGGWEGEHRWLPHEVWAPGTTQISLPSYSFDKGGPYLQIWVDKAVEDANWPLPRRSPSRN